MDKAAAVADIESVMRKPSDIETGGSSAVIAAASRYYACVCRYCPPGTPYRMQADRFVELPAKRKDRDPYPDQALFGVLSALKQDIANGMLTTFEELVRGDIYADLLAMADGLRRDAYYRAAATLAGAALEEHQRKLAAKYSIPTAGKKATEVNSDLKKAGAYGEPMRATIEGYQKTRNAAAHGDPGFEGSDVSLVGNVEPMIVGVRAFVAQYPA